MVKRRTFIHQLGGVTAGFLLAPSLLSAAIGREQSNTWETLPMMMDNEDIFSFINRVNGSFDLSMYRKILGHANAFKEGDEIAGIAAPNESQRELARTLLSNTVLGDIIIHPIFQDNQSALITADMEDHSIQKLTFGRLKEFLLTQSEDSIKQLPHLHSDQIACVVKLMSNEELIAVSQKIFHPLPQSQIGAKGYMGARVQPNSPTDDPEDIFWQVMNAWSFAVGDVVLGTNPVSSEPSSVAKIESTLQDIIETFSLTDTIPHCVLSHIDVQATVEKMQPESTGIWFQSIAGTDAANQTFDITIDKMKAHVAQRRGRYGLYAETGQGADGTNGHGEGFDMVIHESRKYGFMRHLKKLIATQKADHQAWVHVNDVAGFIGPEVFRTKEQLVRCCLEDLVMGKLHGLTIGLDICSTLHMDVSLDDLDWCIQQIMPANPAYLMALPTKNDPMLSYLTTSFSDHVKIRKDFGFKVNDKMWNFFKVIQVIDNNNQPTKYFGNPIAVYYQYLLRKGDQRTWEEIKIIGQEAIERVEKRGVPIAQGFGENTWDLEPRLDKEIRSIYEDAKMSIWQEWSSPFIKSISPLLTLQSQSQDRKDYIYHPQSGEKLSDISRVQLSNVSNNFNYWDIQVILSDGLNVLSLSDEGHLKPFLDTLYQSSKNQKWKMAPSPIMIKNGRVRTGYQCGSILFGQQQTHQKKAIIHLIGERPGTPHRNYSVYMTMADCLTWGSGKVDHDITQVISGISNTAFSPAQAAQDVVNWINQRWL